LHLVDGTSPTLDEDYRAIITELELYGGDLADKPRVTALNKIDALDDEERIEARTRLEAEVGGPVMMLSGVSGEGVPEVLRAVRAQITADRLRMTQADADEDQPWRP
jgi:GTP-binding protein